jgi:lipopolysaccharide/colanic/teichoic acid biosynthesis glycosyltransferase
MSVRHKPDLPHVAEAHPSPPRDGSSPLIDEELFSHLLVRERKRAERSNRPFILLSLEAKDRLDPVLRALAAVIRRTDIVGWVKWPTVAGVIFLEIGDSPPMQAMETVRARIYRELGRHLDVQAIADCSLEFRIYPEPSDGDSNSGLGPADPIFHPDLPREERARKLSNWIKRALDIFASVTLLVGLAPLLLAVAAVVWLTCPGQVLFRQIRIGKMGKQFKMLKFRTMYVNAAETAHYEYVTKFIKESGRNSTTPTNGIFKLTNDPRVTPIGHFLRKTSIDELPQLWNVLIGEMSLVGPRPPLPYELRHYAPWHRRRILEAKPGITGLWQVEGRSRTTFDEMVRLDLQYARARSLWTDLLILFRTPAAVLGGNGAW